jgi:diguanylate cyclase (GGDEF)-like protein
MQLPLPPPAAERAARKYFLPALAILHLTIFHVFRFAGLPDATPAWTASSFLVAGILLFRDFATPRREHRLPDVLFQMAWGVTALLELHVLSPAVASSRIVPAVVFPAVSFLLPAQIAAIFAFASLCFLTWSPSLGFADTGTVVSIAAMAVLGIVTGRIARSKLMAGKGEIPARKPIGRSRSLVLPWEGIEESGSGGFPEIPEGENNLARREEELTEGIQRVLDGVLPIAGADRVMYVSPSHVQGRPLVARYVAPRGKGDDWLGREIPDSYMPLRETMIFRREFIAEGEESSQWGSPRDGRTEQPSGIAAVPVIGDGKEEGAVLAFRFGEGRWTEPVIPVLEMGSFFIAREIAETRRRYRHEKSLERHVGFNRLARTIAEAAEKSTAGGEESASPRREVYKTATEQIRVQLRADRVLLIEADERRMRGRVAWGNAEREDQETTAGVQEEDAWVGLSGTYAEWVLKNNVQRIFSGIRTTPGKHPILPEKWIRKDEDACLLVPLDGAGGFRGILICASRENHGYQKRDVEAVKEILAIMRMGISHALHIETLEERAKSDSMTGLLNQKTFRERLSGVLSRLDGRYECAVIMIDIDHFKRINDTYGHPAGDDVLRKVAKIIKKMIRKADMAARYGGEEFALYLYQADREKALHAAERLRLIIGQTRFEFGGKEVGITASLGIACYPSDGRDSREILERADEALYRSKQGGRNRTTVYQDPA